MPSKKLSLLEKKINYTFKDKTFLEHAMMHRSFRIESQIEYDNQRLEFLGDAVIEIVLTEYLFLRYPNKNEGELTKLRSVFACQEMLSSFAKKLNIGNFIKLGKGETDDNGQKRASILCDAFEALIGAIYLDSNLNNVKGLLIPLVEQCGADPEELLPNLNPKGTLQEYSQKHYNETPEYKLEDLRGPDHSPIYTISVWLKQQKLATESGNKRKTAESNAAKVALKILKRKKILTEEKKNHE